MALSKSELQNLDIIEGGNNYRDAGYDFTVREIYVPHGNGVSTSFCSNLKSWARRLFCRQEPYTIPPQGVVMVFSNEKIKVPKNVIGIATLKNSLSESGVFALSGGFIDPGYEGYMSAILLNFSKKPREIPLDSPFLRAIFMNISGECTSSADNAYTKDFKIYSSMKMNLYSQIPGRFLNMESIIDEVAEKVHNRMVTWTAAFMVAVMVGLVIFQIFAPEIKKIVLDSVPAIQMGKQNDGDKYERPTSPIGNAPESK